MKIQFTVNGSVIAATLADNRMAGEFARMLPLTITMHDFFGREKFGALPASACLSGKGTQTREYEVGDLVCWAPGPDLSILYRQDGQPISGAWHFLGRIDEGAALFAEPGPLQVTIEAAPKTLPFDLRRRRARQGRGTTA